MLQKHPFFSSPLIFFGSNSEEEGDNEEDWTLSIHSDTQTNPRDRIGLFILWTDPEEWEDQQIVFPLEQTERESHFS